MQNCRPIFLILFFLGNLSLLVRGQSNQWTWINGNHILTTPTPNYGTQGVAAANNYPGARSGSMSCTDANGSLWLFGGNGKDIQGTEGTLNDLWKWDGTNWTWISGSNFANQSGNYGTQGLANANNMPPSRAFGNCGVDNNGILWLFGGTHGGSDIGENNGLNDLWKWDGTNWTWVSGSTYPSHSGYYWAYHGSLGVADNKNLPGGRAAAVSWMDSHGNFWIFSGSGYGDSALPVTNQSRSGDLNDLWKWDGTNWTWIMGSKYAEASGSYGIQGVTSAGNIPSARYGSSVASDNLGNTWLFGGSSDSSFIIDYKNDLWKWDGTSWTWVSGSDTALPQTVFGSKGIASPGNSPGGRYHSNIFIDSTGNIWLFGGATYTCYGNYLNELWKWDKNNWTWVSGSDTANNTGNYGTLSVSSSNNTPSSRSQAISWIDKKNRLFMLGGLGIYNNAIKPRALNDMWLWDGSRWAWINGLNSFESGAYGTQGIASNKNKPLPRSNGINWLDKNGNFWLFGGQQVSTYCTSTNLLNDLWKWDGNNWTWISGSSLNQQGSHGILGVASSTNIPGARQGSASWYDNNDNIWLFGGQVIDSQYSYKSSYLNDLWKWDGNNWTWVKSQSVPPAGAKNGGNYGLKGIANSANIPGARIGSASWADKKGNLWLFGGSSQYASYIGATVGNLNDLWKWDGVNWTWIKGDTISEILSFQGGAVYGVKGVADSANTPGIRSNCSIWQDSNDNVWLFGGTSSFLRYPASGGPGYFVDPVYFNDLWKWDGTNWTWISGNKTPADFTFSGNYGIQGVPSATNLPPERHSAASWIDNLGHLWLFGGISGSTQGYLSDLWVWDGMNWIWMNGPTSLNQLGNYGNIGLSDPSNVPAARSNAFSWIDNKNNLWLFGGVGNFDGGSILYNDLWKFNSAVVTALSNTPQPLNSPASILLLDNPSTTDQFHFVCNQFYQTLRWQLIDINGAVMQEGLLKTVMKGATQTVTTNSLSKGIYLIRFWGDKTKTETVKWIRE